MDDDVLVEDLPGAYSLAFDVDDFNGATFGGEWVVGIGDYLEAGFGASFYQKTVPSVYARRSATTAPRSPRISSCASCR